jgi:hypothetical protein
MRSRAFRRDAEQRKKEWVKKTFQHQYWNGMDEVQIGVRAHTPKTCSCQACGNPRKHWNQKTIQERRAPTY